MRSPRVRRFTYQVDSTIAHTDSSPVCRREWRPSRVDLHPHLSVDEAPGDQTPLRGMERKARDIAGCPQRRARMDCIAGRPYQNCTATPSAHRRLGAFDHSSRAEVDTAYCDLAADLSAGRCLQRRQRRPFIWRGVAGKAEGRVLVVSKSTFHAAAHFELLVSLCMQPWLAIAMARRSSAFWFGSITSLSTYVDCNTECVSSFLFLLPPLWRSAWTPFVYQCVWIFFAVALAGFLSTHRSDDPLGLRTCTIRQVMFTLMRQAPSRLRAFDDLPAVAMLLLPLPCSSRSPGGRSSAAPRALALAQRLDRAWEGH